MPISMSARCALALCWAVPCANAARELPHFAHVLIVIEENHAFSEVIGSPAAPYLQALANGGALMTQSFALAHPSQPNYLMLFSGDAQGVIDDSVYPHSQFSAPNLGAKLLAAGFSFAGYSETMPSVGYDGASAGIAPATYKRKHNPWVNWQDASVPLPPNKLPPSVNLPFAGHFPDAAAFDTLPALCFVIPNQLHDMHDGTIAQADSWLQANLGAYAAWCGAHDSLLIVSFDEDDGTANNQIATIFYGACVQPGLCAQPIDTYDLLRTLEQMFGLPHDAGSASAQTITGIWDPACVAWNELGGALAGAGGAPVLAAQGALGAGAATSFALSHAAAAMPGALVLGVQTLDLPLFGGLLVPDPFLLRPFTSSAVGTASWNELWPAGLPSGLSVYAQAWLLDPSAVQGFAASAALGATSP